MQLLLFLISFTKALQNNEDVEKDEDEENELDNSDSLNKPNLMMQFWLKWRELLPLIISV